MIKLSRQVDYAFQLLQALGTAQDHQYVSLKKVSLESTISFLFLQKIAQQLRAAGLIQAAKGQHGGYLLVKPLRKISLREVVEAIDGPYGLATCNRPGEVCAKSHHCTIKKGVRRLQSQVARILQTMMVSDMVDSA